MSINATALYPWLQTPTVEKFPPENKFLKIQRTVLTSPGLANFQVFSQTLANGGILSHFLIDYLNNGVDLDIRGHRLNINGGGMQDFTFSSGSFVNLVFGTTATRRDFIYPMGIRFSSSLIADIRLTNNVASGIVVYAFYYEL
jgi:hypothetical protein